MPAARRLLALLAITLLALVGAGCGEEEDTAPAGEGLDSTTDTDDGSEDGEGAPTEAPPTGDEPPTPEGGPPTTTPPPPAAGSTLVASVGPGFTISLTDGTGAPVSELPAGSYTIQVDDQADNHNFHLTGPGGVDESTTVPEVGTATWEVTFEPGEYTYVCDPHASSMTGSFSVT